MSGIVEVRVGKSRRITLPSEFNVKDGDMMSAVITEKGNLVFIPIKSTQGKTRLFACPIGIWKNRYWGVVIDSNGIIGARVNSSNRDYLIQDLTLPNNKGLGNKLDAKFGSGFWTRPEYVNEESMPKKTIEMIQKLKRDLHFGIWPPERTC
jgi:hypothetical protein